MKQILLSLPVQGKKDLVLVRQRTRQLAALLGFSAEDQAVLASVIFDRACRVYQQRRPTSWIFRVENRQLRIAPSSPLMADLGVHKRLPEYAVLSEADLSWVIRQVCRLTPVDIFAEMQKLNQEILQALLGREVGAKSIRPAA
jgi:hypothetical protein